MKLLEMNHIKKEFDGLGVLKDISVGGRRRNRFYHRSFRFRQIHDACCATMLEEIDGGEILYMGKKLPG